MGEGEDLKAAAVSDDGTITVDKFVEATTGLDYIGPRLEEEVVSVAESELLSCLITPVVIDSFERAVGGDGDEARRIDDAVRGMESPYSGPGPFFLGLMQQLKAEEVLALVGRKDLSGRRQGHGVEFDLAFLLLFLGKGQGGLVRGMGCGCGASRCTAAG